MVKQVAPGTSAAGFQQQIDGQFAVVDFFAQWCGPCKMIAPVVDQLSALHPHITFLKVDVDQCPELSAAYKIAAMPTFILFARGKEMARMTGADLTKLRELLQRATVKAASAPTPAGAVPASISGIGTRLFTSVAPSLGFPSAVLKPW